MTKQQESKFKHEHLPEGALLNNNRHIQQTITLNKPLPYFGIKF